MDEDHSARAGFTLRRRLRTVSLGVALVILAVALTVYFMSRWDLFPAPPRTRPRTTPVLPLLGWLSLVMFGATYLEGLSQRALGRLGTLYQLTGAGLLAFKAGWGGASVQPGYFTWLGVWILLFPLVVPRSLWRDLALAGLSALAPLFFVVLGRAWRGEGLPTPAAVFLFAHPYLACAGLALGPSYVVHRLRLQLASAVERWRELGSYRLVHRLAEGGMGEVWYAEHRLLTRPAALKLVRSDKLDLADEDERAETLARFELEAQETSLLSSAHTVTVYDFGLTPEGSLYLVMELLEGLDLDRFVREHGPLPASRVVHVLRQVCASLAEAHAHGLVHRDIKPANIFLSRSGLEEDFVKVLDFGLIALRDRRRLPALCDDAGYLVGTPTCMAPEQVLGRAVDNRTDLYGLGCVAYYLLTGRYPFEAEQPIELLTQHAHDEPLPPSAVPLASYVPPELERLVLSCLAKDPQERPPSAQVLASALARLPLASWGSAEAAHWWRAQRSGERPGLAALADPEVRASTLFMPQRLRRTG